MHRDLSCPYVAIVAGEGTMAALVKDSVAVSGKIPFIFAIKGVTSRSITDDSTENSVWLHLCQLGKVINQCKKKEILEMVFAGRIPHRKIFDLSLLHMDWQTFKLLLHVKDMRADSLLSAIANLFSSKGIDLLDSTRYLKNYLACEGVLTINKPDKSLLEEIDFGLKIMRELYDLDIGQTIVVKRKSIVAIEAMEGTDLCLERAGSIAGKGCVAIKLAKKNQDMRFDVPVIGLNTIQKLVKIDAKALVIQAEKTLILDRQAIEYANIHGLTIVSIKEFPVDIT